MDPEEKQKFVDAERERYLEKLRQRSDRRDIVKELRDQAFVVRAEHAEKTADQYLKRIARRTEFRAEVKQHWHAGHKLREETLKRLGSIYKERLGWFVGRTLGISPNEKQEGQ